MLVTSNSPAVTPRSCVGGLGPTRASHRAIQRTTRLALAKGKRRCLVHNLRRQERPPDDRLEEEGGSSVSVPRFRPISDPGAPSILQSQGSRRPDESERWVQFPRCQSLSSAAIDRRPTTCDDSRLSPPGMVQTRVTLGGVKPRGLLAERPCPDIVWGGNSTAAPRKKCYPGSEPFEPGPPPEGRGYGTRRPDDIPRAEASGKLMPAVWGAKMPSWLSTALLLGAQRGIDPGDVPDDPRPARRPHRDGHPGHRRQRREGVQPGRRDPPHSRRCVSYPRSGRTAIMKGFLGFLEAF
jgi:hypothetical protein